MSKYPVINYIGNKRKVTDWIVENMPVKQGVVLDLFCGGCSVSYALKEKGYSVISNDALYSNFILAKAIIENKNEVLSLNEINIPDSFFSISTREKIDFFSNHIYFDYEVDELAKLINFSSNLEGNKKFLFLSLLRRAMIRKIPYSRMNVKWEEIQKFRDEEYSYEKYGRRRHYHNVPFINHIKDNLKGYNEAVFDNYRVCRALNLDALECIEGLVEKVDVIYLDPPYPSTMNKYNEFYGYFDMMLDVPTSFKIDLTDKKTFLDNFYRIADSAKTKSNYLLISLNNKCYPSADLLSERLKPLMKNIQVFTKNHVYKVTGKENKKTNFEILILCEYKED